MTPKPSNNMNQQDRDVLIEIRTKVDYLQAQVSSLENNFSGRLDRVEKEKVNYTDLNLIRETIEKNLSQSTKETDRLENVKETKTVVDDLSKLVTAQGQNVEWVRSKMMMALGILAAIQFLGAGLIILALKSFLQN